MPQLAVDPYLSLFFIGLLAPAIGPLIIAAADRLHPPPPPSDARRRCSRNHSRRFVTAQMRRCAACGSLPPAHLIAVELISSASLIVVYAVAGLTVQFAALLAAVSLLIAIAVIDLEQRLVPNRAVLYGVAFGLLAAPFWTELGTTRSFLGGAGLFGSLANSMLAAAGAGLFALAVYLISPRSIGGGDVKYAFLLGLLLGYPGILAAGLVTALAGGAWAVYLLTARREIAGYQVPYGVFMSAGAIPALLWGGWMFDAYLGLIRPG